MTDLAEYGFTQTVTAERWVEYEGHGFNVTVYNYFKKIGESEVIHHSFVVSSKQCTSRSRPVSELADWLGEKKITKSKI